MALKSKPARLSITSFFLICLIAPNSWGDTGNKAREIIENRCAGCHKFSGNAESRLKLKAPDLMWAGVKFKRPWLVSWLMGNEENVYQKNYRWDLSRESQKHIALSREDAETVADYFENHLMDPRVKKDAIVLSKFSKIQYDFGRQLFIEHSCTGCHQIMDNGQKLGGPQSVSFFNSGKRLNKDWIYRFNSNPPDFVPHSGEFVADVSELGLYYVTGFLATEGDDDFKFYEPWESEFFQQADSMRGKQIYKEYCAQCHGETGLGDGPAASGLEPKPAVHAKMAIDRLPLDYLYNVVNYGGKSVGKSPYMPYWGLTLGQQGVADVILYMRQTFKQSDQGETVASAKTTGPLGDCPQSRKTRKAPLKFQKMKNPLPVNPTHVRAGEKLFLKKAKPLACAQCHGKKGDGKGLMGGGLKPAPRNFTCGSTMEALSDGQLFWVIKNGSPGTGMMAFKNLRDTEIWQLIHYIRGLAR